MEVRVGNLELIESTSLLIPPDREVFLEFKTGTWLVKLQVVFVTDTEKPEAAYTVEAAGDHAVLILKNWSNSLAMGMEEPVPFGEADDKKLYFQCFGQALGKSRRLNLWFFRGDK